MIHPHWLIEDSGGVRCIWERILKMQKPVKIFSLGTNGHMALRDAWRGLSQQHFVMCCFQGDFFPLVLYEFVLLFHSSINRNTSLLILNLKAQGRDSKRQCWVWRQPDRPTWLTSQLLHSLAVWLLSESLKSFQKCAIMFVRIKGWKELSDRIFRC